MQVRDVMSAGPFRDAGDAPQGGCSPLLRASDQRRAGHRGGRRARRRGERGRLSDQGTVATPGAGTHGVLAWLVREAPDEAEVAKVEAATAGAAMSSPAVTVCGDCSIREAASLMVDARVNRLPVVDEGRLVGIVTRPTSSARTCDRTRSSSRSSPARSCMTPSGSSRARSASMSRRVSWLSPAPWTAARPPASLRALSHGRRCRQRRRPSPVGAR